jgi:hypothetical protein
MNSETTIPDVRKLARAKTSAHPIVNAGMAIPSAVVDALVYCIWNGISAPPPRSHGFWFWFWFSATRSISVISPNENPVLPYSRTPVRPRVPELERRETQRALRNVDQRLLVVMVRPRAVHGELRDLREPPGFGLCEDARGDVHYIGRGPRCIHVASDEADAAGCGHVADFGTCSVTGSGLEGGLRDVLARGLEAYGDVWRGPLADTRALELGEAVDPVEALQDGGLHFGVLRDGSCVVVAHDVSRVHKGSIVDSKGINRQTTNGVREFLLSTIAVIVPTMGRWNVCE